MTRPALSGEAESFSVTYSEDGKRLVEITCQYCGKLFTTEYKFRNGRKYCSLSCGSKGKSPRITLTCAQCGRSFERRPSNMGRSKSNLSFCSRECKTQAQRIGGIKAIQPEHYGSARSAYRSIALRHYGQRCSRCGYNSDVRMLDVDHIDADRNNNELANLQVLCVWCHSMKTRGVEQHNWDGNLAQ